MKSFFIFLCFVSVSSGLDRPRGVSLEKASFYAGGTEFRCLSDGKTIPMDHVNDDYCDCDDGSDEPGTSACSNGLFYCNNKEYKGSYIMSSRVNDGVCDCCDGSDEYDGTISCEDTCDKLFAAIRAEQIAFREKQEKGYKIKQEYIQQGHRARDEKTARLTEVTKEKELVVQEKNTLEAAKDAAEAPEKEAKDKHEQAWEAVKAERKKQKEAIAAKEAFTELDVNQDNIVDYPELMKHSEFDIDSDGTVSEEEAREYLEESEQVDLATFTEKIWPNIKEIFKSAIGEEKEGEEQAETVSDVGEAAGDPPKDPEIDIPEGGAEDPFDGRYDDDNIGDEDEEDDDDDEDDEDLDAEYDISRSGRRGRKPDHLSDKLAEEDKMPDYDDETKKLIEVADEARRKYDDVDRKLKDLENEITGINKYLELDLGPEEEFSALKGQCFEYTDREYTYRFCPFEKTSQKPKGGGIETNLGNWGHWYGPEEDKYDAMKYENGQGCWNGPNRSCHVNLHCGAENALIGASEPSRCEYQFEFTTPARCAKPEPPGSHDVHEEL